MKFSFLFCILSIYSVVSGQKETSKKDSIPHPFKKAMLYSACLPGAGQVYNSIKSTVGHKKAYWKVPLIYAALGTTSYFLISNQLTQKSLREEYSFRTINNTTSNSEWEQYDNDAVLTLYKQYLNMRDLSILGIAAVYFIQIADAGVEAHFLHFDVSDKLTLKIEPTLMNYKSTGIRMQLSFR
jgi:hypothetical protein